ncbi:MAG: DegT/DnrJ/EryC1/StrS family aminotransferase, partial [Nitrospirales bacterium]
TPNRAVLDTLIGMLERRGVRCRRPVFQPLHRYVGLDGFPNSERAAQRALSIPIYPSLTDQDVHRIVQVVNEELAHAL